MIGRWEPVVIALGSNLQNPPSQIATAFRMLQGLAETRQWQLSPIFRSPPWGITEQAEFANAVALAEVALAPSSLLQAMHTVETQMGRDRTVPRNGPRVIDLDLICFGQRRLSIPQLSVPHPRASERAFVLGPWLALAPDARLANGELVSACWDRLPADARDSLKTWV